MRLIRLAHPLLFGLAVGSLFIFLFANEIVHLDKFNGLFSGYALNLHYQSVAVSILSNPFPSYITDYVDGKALEHNYSFHGYTPFLYPVARLILERTLNVNFPTFLFFAINIIVFFASLWQIFFKNRAGLVFTSVLFILSLPTLTSLSVVGYESLATICIGCILFTHQRFIDTGREPYRWLLYAFTFFYGFSSWFGFFFILCMSILRFITPLSYLSAFTKNFFTFFVFGVSGVIFLLSLFIANNFYSVYDWALSRTVVAPNPYAESLDLTFAASRIAIFFCSLLLPWLTVLYLRRKASSVRSARQRSNFLLCVTAVGLISLIFILPWSLRHPHSWVLAIIPWYIYCGTLVNAELFKHTMFGIPRARIMWYILTLSLAVMSLLTLRWVEVSAHGQEFLANVNSQVGAGRVLCVATPLPCGKQPKQLLFLLSKNTPIYFYECPIQRHESDLPHQVVEVVCAGDTLRLISRP